MDEEIQGTEYVPSEEEKAANAILEKQSVDIQRLEEAQQAAKESALNKLKKLGLTKLEAKAVIGIN